MVSANINNIFSFVWTIKHWTVTLPSSNDGIFWSINVAPTDIAIIKSWIKV